MPRVAIVTDSSADLADSVLDRHHIAIVPLQDVLGLGGEARMNVPGLVDERNWGWRLKRDALTPQLAERLREATAEAGRLRLPAHRA